MMECRASVDAVLFDMDGVLVDTESQYTSFWTDEGRRYFPEDMDFAVRLKGQTLTRIFELYFPNDELSQQAIKGRLESFEQQMSYPLYAGGMELVTSLRKRGIKVAVVTSSNRAKMSCLYATHPYFIKQFDRVFTAEDFAHSKPDPDPYLTAARYFGLGPESCVVIEDSLGGVRSGQAAGMPVIGVATTLPAQTLQPYCSLVVPGIYCLTVDDINKVLTLCKGD